jgi:hypothetical protein
MFWWEGVVEAESSLGSLQKRVSSDREDMIISLSKTLFERGLLCDPRLITKRPFRTMGTIAM